MLKNLRSLLPIYFGYAVTEPKTQDNSQVRIKPEILSTRHASLARTRLTTLLMTLFLEK